MSLKLCRSLSVVAVSLLASVWGSHSWGATISGCVVLDLTCNGVIDHGIDLGADGTAVDLLDLNGNVLASTTAATAGDAPGFYEFANVPDAQFLVRVGEVPGHFLGSVECLSTTGACDNITENPKPVDLSKGGLANKLSFLFCERPTGACCLED